MLTLKLRGRHCPTHYIARVGTSSGRKPDGTIIYEINPEVISDVIDELCDKIVETQRENGRLHTELLKLRPSAADPLPWTEDSNRVKVGGGSGD